MTPEKMARKVSGLSRNRPQVSVVLRRTAFGDVD